MSSLILCHLVQLELLDLIFIFEMVREHVYYGVFNDYIRREDQFN
jgi:hypothetical protein